MSDSNFELYLSRAGKTEGPFNAEEIESLRKSGRILEYNWIWNPSRNAWDPISPPPVAPPAHAETQDQHPPARALKKINGLQAVCHDQRTVISGAVLALTSEGCTLSSNASSGTPAFPIQGSVIINLLNPTTGESENVPARLVRAQKTAQGWSYQLSWDTPPALAS